MNLSFVIGNLGSDAVVKESNGVKFVTFSVADTRKYKKQDGSEVETTNWIDCVISNIDHPVLPFLKSGVKVCIIGNSSLRVYSSKKDRMMKAGQTIHVLSIELCGGSTNEVPRQLIDPETSAILDVTKHYWCPLDTSKMKKDEYSVLVDSRGRQFMVNKGGFVAPVPTQDNADSDSDSESNTNAQ